MPVRASVSRPRWRPLATALVSATLAAACAGPVPSPAFPAPSATPSPTLSAGIAAAIEIRALYGLRNDEAYARSVAANPTATTDVLGIPLLPAEVVDLKDRAKDRNRVVATVEAYGKQHEDAWAGLYLDETSGGDIVARFTGDLVMHEAAIRRRIGPFGRLRLELAERSLAELQAHVDAIEADRGWFASIGAPLRYASFEPGDDVVVAHVSSADPEAAAKITDHFDGEGWLVVESDGIGPWLGGTGKLRIQIVDEWGNPLIPNLDEEEYTCRVKPDNPGAWGGGAGAVGPDGVCRFPEPLGATGYDITIEHEVLGSDRVVVGHGRARVTEDQVTEVTIPVKTLEGMSGRSPVFA